MSIIYRTDGAWGTGKGSNLAPAEVDGNFHDLDQRVEFITDNPVEPIVPISIAIEGYNFTMGLSDGSTLGPIVMTMPVPQWRGDWAPGVAYSDMDFFTAPDGGFGAVMQEHTSAATFDWAATAGGLPIYREIVGGSGTTAGLNDLTDVTVSGSADGDFLIYNLAAHVWENKTKASVATTILPAFVGDTGSGGARGVVPAPAAGDAAAGKVLGAGGSWVVPPTGSGGGSSSLAGLSDVAISAPANNSLLQYKTSDGKWHNQTIASLGAGTVTQVDTGPGLSGGPITTTGLLSLAQIASHNLLANPTGSSASPIATTLSQLLDAVLGTARGSLLHRTATGWTALAPGTAGLYLQTGGAGADAGWAAPAGSGTVTTVNSGSGLSGGPITTTGTLSLAAISDNQLLANITGASAAPSGVGLSLILDHILGTTQGAVLYRSGTAWTALAPGTAGQVLTTGGAAANPSWAAAGSGSLPSGTNGDQLMYVSGAWTAQRPRYVVSTFVPGVPTASQLLLLHRISKAITIPGAFAAYLGHASQARGTVNATATTVIDVQKATSASPGSFSSVGSISFSAGTMVGSFATTGGTAVSFAQGDTIQLVAPGTPDATFANFAATLVGYET